METPLLEVEDLHVSFQTEEGTLTAVDGMSFDIYESEVLGLVGESGSGKSVTSLSLLRLLDSSSSVEAETLRYKGEDLLEKPERGMRDIRSSEISIIFQDPMSSLNPVMTIGEQIAEVVRHHTDVSESTGFVSELGRKYVTGTNKNSASWQKAVELLAKVGISDPERRAKEYPHQLSGGMCQRVMIAQALAGNPSLIIADEPTTALDVSIEAQILNEFLELRNEFDISILLITHDLAVVRETCDRVAVMYAGELMETADVDDLFASPQHPYTRGLINSIPRITDQREWLDTIEGSVPDLVNKPEGCPFRERCDYAFELCDQPLVEYSVDDGTRVAQCHLHNDFVTTDEDGEVRSVDERAYETIDGAHVQSGETTPRRTNANVAESLEGGNE